MQWQDIFISTAALSDHLSNSSHSLQIFDCRFSLMDPQAGFKAFSQDAIPGASYLHLDHDLSGDIHPSCGRHPLPSSRQLQKLKTRLGLNSESQVVCYDDGKLAFASRAWFIFQLMGVHRVRILEGGFLAWKSRQSLECEPAPARVSPITPAKLPVKLIELDEIMASPDSFQLIDARETTRFQGDSEPIDRIAGHIPGALNRVWLDAFDESGQLRPFLWHKERWQDRDQDVIDVHYCGSGVTALVNLWSYALGSKKTLAVYPGGWSEYINSIYYK